MRTFAIFLVSLAATTVAYAQNTFPASGNVGIGTASPVDKLDIAGGDWSGIYLRHQAIGGVGTLKWSPTGVYGTGRFLLLSNETPNTMGTGQDGGILFRINQGPSGGYTVPAMAILQSGNVGIGTTNPLTKLHVVGAQGLTGSISTGAASRPAVGTSLIDGEIHAYDLVGALGDGGLLRLSAGGGTNADVKSYIDLTGYNQTSEVGQSVSIGTSGVERVRVNPSGNVGIGTPNPAGSRLVVYDPSKPPISWGASSDIGFLSWGAANEAIIRSVNALKLQTNGGGTDAVWITTSGNVGIGTTNPTEKLSVKGRIRAQEVVVDNNNWSDYVLADDYKLQSLSEVEAQIKTDKHLPGVPSAQEVSEKGVSVGDMQAVLLAKIEELTLHQIAQEKELGALRTEVSALRAEKSQLK